MSRLRRVPVACGLILVVLAVIVGLIGGAPTGAGAQADADGPDLGPVHVVKVSGLLDDVLLDLIYDRLAGAEAEGASALVLQMNSPGAIVSDERVVELATAMTASPVPVSVWVGPSGSRARGASAQLAAIGEPSGIAVGARLGQAGPQILPAAEFGSLWGDLAAQMENRTIKGAEPADDVAFRDLGIVVSPTLGDFIINLENVATRVTGSGEDSRREIDSQVKFFAPGLDGQMMHTAASPAVAYLMFAIGMGLLIFELFTAGIGVAGVIGAICLALGSYGMVALPVRWWAVALLVLSFVACAVDVQTGVPRFWTGAGIVMFVIATFTLFTNGVSMSWFNQGVGIIGMLLTFLSGVPSMVRTRFSTPTIGREWMIGEMGLALTEVKPEGTVSVRSAQWPALTNRATPVAAGDRIRVIGIQGVVLEIEPAEGGAQDYRERARKPRSDD